MPVNLENRRTTLGKILLVDDDAVFRREFKGCFDDYEILEASSGDEAIDLLSRPNEVDLVILDVRLPGADGIEVMSEIKKVAPGSGVIILTGYSSKDIAIEALRGQADSFIEKPFNIDTAKSIIDDVLKRRNGHGFDDIASSFSKLERVKRFVCRNYFKRLGLKDASDAVCLSPKYLSRIFKQRFGIGFNAYRLALKIDHAKVMLKESGYNVNQISAKLGYKNTESFIRSFKKVTGFSPTQYRKKKIKGSSDN